MTDKRTRRPVIADILRALHNRSRDQLGYSMKMNRIHEHYLKGLLDGEGATYDDIYDAALGAQELGLVAGVDDEDRWSDEAILTDAGRAWSESDELPAIKYVYRVEGELAVGTLANWARAWEHSRYSDIRVDPVLLTWDHREGFEVRVDLVGETRDDYLDYRIWAAGETASVRIDGRA